MVESKQEQIVPLILTEENNLIIEIRDSELSLDNKEFREFNPTENISLIEVKQDDQGIKITITGKNNPPTAQVNSETNQLIFNINDSQNRATTTNLADINITITGTRTPRPVLDSANSVSILTSEQIDKQLIRNIADLIRYEPGVSVGNAAGRFGNQDFNIRGIGGNRVLLQVDGVRTPDNYVGRGRDYFDPETMKRVEIIKGPGSALYGSDAIGGVVSFITNDPQDYLNILGKPLYTSIKTSYGSSDESLSVSGVVAAETEDSCR